MQANLHRVGIGVTALVLRYAVRRRALNARLPVFFIGVLRGQGRRCRQTCIALV